MEPTLRVVNGWNIKAHLPLNSMSICSSGLFIAALRASRNCAHQSDVEVMVIFIETVAIMVMVMVMVMVVVMVMGLVMGMVMVMGLVMVMGWLW